VHGQDVPEQPESHEVTQEQAEPEQLALQITSHSPGHCVVHEAGGHSKAPLEQLWVGQTVKHPLGHSVVQLGAGQLALSAHKVFEHTVGQESPGHSVVQISGKHGLPVHDAMTHRVAQEEELHLSLTQTGSSTSKTEIG